MGIRIPLESVTYSMINDLLQASFLACFYYKNRLICLISAVEVMNRLLAALLKLPASTMRRKAVKLMLLIFTAAFRSFPL